MRKILIFIMIFTILSGLMPVSALNNSQPSSKLKTFVDEAIKVGLVPSSIQKNYSQPITREQLSSLIVNTIELKTKKSIELLLEEKRKSLQDNPFIDTKNEDILAVYQLKIITGKSANTFAPEKYILRKEAAVILTNAADAIGCYTYNLPSNFRDAKVIDSWAKNAVDYVTDRKIMDDAGNGSFNPNGNFTVEQAIVSALKFYKDDGVLRISAERRKKILEDGKIKAAETNTSDMIYPIAWYTKDKNGKQKFMGFKPVGSIAGYALESDTSVYIDGKHIKSYKVGNFDVVDLDDLKEFGFNLTRNGKLNIIQVTDKTTTAEYNDKKVDKSSYLVGNVVYTLIGTDQIYYISDTRKHKTLQGECEGGQIFITSTGKKLVVVDGLAGRFYISEEQKNISRYSYNYTACLLVDYSNPKEIKMHTVNKKESDQLSLSDYFWAIGKYPSMAKQILGNEEKAVPVARKIVSEIIKPEMNESEIVKEIQTFLSSYAKCDYSPIAMGYGMQDDPKDYADAVLTGKDGNWRGWYRASKLIYSLAGIDLYPAFGSDMYNYGTSTRILEDDFYAFVDGEWIKIKFFGL